MSTSGAWKDYVCPVVSLQQELACNAAAEMCRNFTCTAGTWPLVWTEPFRAGFKFKLMDTQLAETWSHFQIHRSICCILNDCTRDLLISLIYLLPGELAFFFSSCQEVTGWRRMCIFGWLCCLLPPGNVASDLTALFLAVSVQGHRVTVLTVFYWCFGVYFGVAPPE